MIIVGIHTGIGKTICSAVLCEALGWDYWKPVQAGDLLSSDSMVVKSLISNNKSIIHTEQFKLRTAASPHYAAEVEKLEIKLSDFKIPTGANKTVIETAGGIMSPLSNSLLNIDLIAHLNMPVILVSNNYLGSINHTLLTIECLKNREVPIKGIVFIGDENKPTEKFITLYTNILPLFSIPIFPVINTESIKEFTKKFSDKIGLVNK